MTGCAAALPPHSARSGSSSRWPTGSV
jgi:hypothetical protein